jgi:hypothetical protein
MQSVVGVFRSLDQAQQAIRRLTELGIRPEDINLLAPGDHAKAEQLPVDPTEQPGMGATMGGFMGATIGAAAGLGGGAAIASLLVPGVGPVMAIGFAATALLGLGGAAIGAKAGEAVENRDTHGLPEDEIFLYEDALRQGRTVVVVFAPDSDAADRVRAALAASGAESLDAAREQWWTGLRGTEKEHYVGGDFAQDEPRYRRGFEAAMSNRGRTFEEGRAEWRDRYAADSADACFRAGYKRGCDYRRQQQEERDRAA